MKIASYLIVTTITLISCSPKSSPIVEEIKLKPVPNETVSAGRDLYVNDCAKCHKVRKVDAFTSEQWSKILPAMSKKAKFDDTKANQVRAYVDWELAN